MALGKRSWQYQGQAHRWWGLERGIEGEAKELGYTILLGSSRNQIVKEEVYMTLFLSKRVDGIVWIKSPGETTPALLQILKSQSASIVLLDREYPSLPAGNRTC